MIISLKKHLFVGSKEDLDTFFNRAQEKGVVEFIAPSSKRSLEIPKDVQTLSSAIKILNKLPLKEPDLRPLELPFAIELAERIHRLKGDIERFEEEKRFLEMERTRIAPFGDFSMEDVLDIEKEGKRKIQFFCMSGSKAVNEDLIFIASEYDLDYFIAINEESKHYPDMIEMRIDRSLSEVEDHLNMIQETLLHAEAELKGFAVYLDSMQESLIACLDRHHLALAKKEVSLEFKGALFAVEAWVPSNKIGALFSLTQELAVHVEQIAVEKSDRVPTYMENKGAPRIGEDLVRIYDIPAHADKDPSGWVFWAFSLFFAMIVADAGYGLIFLGLALWLRWKGPKLRGQSRRLLKLFTVLSCSCIVWGVLTSSYFGIPIDPKSPLAKLSLLQKAVEKKVSYHFSKQDAVAKGWIKTFPALADQKDPVEILSLAMTETTSGTHIYEMYREFSRNILLEMSLVFGVIHICLSLLRYIVRRLAHIGWICFLIGAYLYFPSMLGVTSFVYFMGWIDPATAAHSGIQLLSAGLVLATAFALIQHRLKGLAEIAHGIQIFADVLSYLRLYAIGLAGVIMADAFNEMGKMLGFVFGAAVILCGHGVNIVLSSVGGIIHGLRLNFIEWYHYSFDGGGKIFNPLRKL